MLSLAGATQVFVYDVALFKSADWFLVRGSGGYTGHYPQLQAGWRTDSLAW